MKEINCKSSFHLQLSAICLQQVFVKFYIFTLPIQLSLTMLMFCGSQGTAQNAGIGINTSGAAPDKSAILDISSTSLGLLIPRMNTNQRNAISSPAESLLIFNTVTQCFEAYYNSGWVSFGCLSNCKSPDTITVSGGGKFCGSATLTASGVTGGTIYYEGTISGGKSTATPSSSQIVSLSGTYYFNSFNNGCWGTQGSATVKINVGGPPSSGCGGLTTMTDSRDGKTYNIVQIGTQCWMAANLNYGIYEALPTTCSQPSGYKYCQNKNQNDDPTCPMGGLYEWANLMQGSSGCNGCPDAPPCSSSVQGLCPKGWHVPSHYEWTLLEQNVGTPPEGSSVFPYDETTINFFGVNEGDNLKEAGQTYWWYTNTGTNKSGFTSRGSGFTEVVGNKNQFVDGGLDCFLWSSSEGSDTSTAWGRNLYWGYGTVARWYYTKTLGMAVRCLKN